MTDTSNAIRDHVMHDDQFQSACQRYAHENGSSAAIATAAVRAYERAALGKLDRDYTRQRIKELIAEGDGFWRACSGCQESSDGYVSERDYPFDPMFACQPGGGCGECGGIGVTWESCRDHYLPDTGAGAADGDTRYYLTDFADEICPCEPTLAGWAAWLAGPDAEFGRDGPATDGQTFAASTLTFDPDIIATRSSEGWTFSRSTDGYDFYAIRFGEGLGWTCDDIADTPAVLAELLDDYAPLSTGENVHIAVARNGADTFVTFHASPSGATCTAAPVDATSAGTRG